VSFIIGDIIGIIEGIWGMIFVIFSIALGVLLFSKYWRIYGLVTLITLLWGGYLGETTLWEIKYVQNTLEQTGIFEGKHTIRGTLEKELFEKERSRVYRLSLDKIDTIDIISTYHGEISRNMTLFVEVPSNLELNKWDQIELSGKIDRGFTFPIEGFERYSLSQWGYGSIYSPSFRRISLSDGGWMKDIRSFWIEKFRDGFPRDVAGILLGLTVGIDNYLDTSVKESFLQSGISHILVVSGSNIAFLILFLSFFLKYTPLGRTPRILIIGSAILFYSTLVWWEVSVVRATIMGILSYLIAEYGERASSLSTLCLAWVILTLISPLSPVYDAGFGLSFGATCGILIFQKPLTRLWKKIWLPHIVHSLITISIGAFLGSMPILLYHFATFPLGSILINILIAWVLGWILFWSILYIPLISLSLTGGYLLGYLIYLPSKYVLWMSDRFSWTPGITIPEEFRIPIVCSILGVYVYLILSRDLFDRWLDPK
jgi:ComEC/Rec2-related protein